MDPTNGGFNPESLLAGEFQDSRFKFEGMHTKTTPGEGTRPSTAIWELETGNWQLPLKAGCPHPALRIRLQT
jgi:hypothetical protein